MRISEIAQMLIEIHSRNCMQTVYSCRLIIVDIKDESVGNVNKSSSIMLRLDWQRK